MKKLGEVAFEIASVALRQALELIAVYYEDGRIDSALMRIAQLRAK